MDSPYESDASEGMKELVERGYAIKRDRDYPCPETGYLRKTRAQVRNLDVSHVQRPWTLNVSSGAASTHGLTPGTQDSVTAAGRNTGTTEAGFEAVWEPRSTTRGGSRRSHVRGFSNEEMLMAYDELERDMNESMNDIDRKITQTTPTRCARGANE